MNGREELRTILPGVLTIGTDTSSPGPFHHGDPGTPDFAGFDVDLCKAIAQRAGLVPQFVSCLWSTILGELNAGRFDMVCTAATITEARRKVVDFSLPYFDVEVSVVARRNSGVSSAEDLHGKRIGVRSSTTAEEALRAYLTGGEIRTYDYNDDAYRELSEGITDAVVDDVPIGQYFTGQLPELKLVGNLRGSSSQYAILFAKGSEALRSAVDRALAQIRAEGLHARLCEKWFGGGR
ncbi:MAG: amino acid ABC transporter substrate-binding protein [Acidobacteria bacterium]|nr:amino acid ABC transporter substrate-binding protein [Acidobacteriota bacterium]MBI3661836.1 amino acid ABC transporter substrate-binding protein [Acidobacteriota bacterium]